ncbi:MAG: dipeptide epimerase, partial [Bacteroidota bacterium]
YTLQFKYPFKIAHGLRTQTDVVYVKLEHEGFTAWGEAALPPYLPETQKSVVEFLSAFCKSVLTNSIDGWFEKLQSESENMSAKAALDMALWHMKSQVENTSIVELLGINEKKFPISTYTIGVSSLNEMKLKVEEADKHSFKVFKIKLNGENDEQMITDFREISDKPFAVDVNQGWDDVNEANDKIEWLKEQGCLFVEQPLHKDEWDEMKLLITKSCLPLYADESCQRISDLERVAEGFNGVNIKLMKCGGITEAYQMILKARALGLNVLIGCMSESSVGCTAAANLSPLADYADLDGPYLISNDPFKGMEVKEGRIQINQLINSIHLPAAYER